MHYNELPDSAFLSDISNQNYADIEAVGCIDTDASSFGARSAYDGTPKLLWIASTTVRSKQFDLNKK